jgi:hypothetical protein
MSLYPPNVVRSLLTFDPTPLRTHAGIAMLVGLHVLFAGATTFVLARRHGLRTGPSLVAAVGFVFSAPWMPRALMHTGFNFQVAWLPLILLCLRHALVEPQLRGRVRSSLVAMVSLGMVFLVGPGPVPVYICVAMGSYWVLHRLIFGGRAAWRRLPVDGALLLLMYAGAFLVAFVVFLPALELMGLSGRARGLGLEIALTQLEFDYTPWKLFTMFSTYSGARHIVRDIQGSGAVVLVLAVVALASPRRREVALFAGLFAVLLDCSIGAPMPVASLLEGFLPDLLGPSPRAAIVLALPLSMLAAFGAELTCDAIPPRARRIAIGVLAAGAGAFACAAIVIGSQEKLFVAAPTVAFAFPVAMSAVVLLSLVRRWRAWPFAALLLVVAEIFIWNQRLLPAQFPPVRGSWESMERLRGERTYPMRNRRGVTPFANANMYYLAPSMNGYESLHIHRVRMFMSSPRNERRYLRRLATEVVTQNHRGNLLLKRLFWLSRQYAVGPLPPKNSLFPAATTVFLEEDPDVPMPAVDADSLPNTSISPEGSVRRELDLDALASGFRYRGAGSARDATLVFPPIAHPGRHSALVLRVRHPRGVYLSFRIAEAVAGGAVSYLKKVEIGSGEDGTLVELPLPDFERFVLSLRGEREQSLRDLEIREAALLSDRLDEDERIRIVTYGANRVEVEVSDLPGHRILTYLDADYPGWSVYVDDVKSRLYRANDVFKAVVVPPGTHRVEFVFSPWRFWVGLLVSLVVLGSALAGASALWVRERARSGTEQRAEGG